MSQAHRDVEEALRQSEARYRRIAANAPGMVYQFARRPDGSFAFPYVSSGAREIFALEPEEIMQDPWLLVNMIHPEDLPGFLASVGESATMLTPWRWEGRFVLASGDLCWIQGASRPELEGNGDILWDGLLMDRTRSKQVEEALQRQNEYLAAMNEATLALMNRHELSELLEMLILRASRLLGAPYGYIYLVDLQSDELVLRVGVGQAAAFVGHRIRRGVGVAGRVWETGKPLYENDYKGWSGHLYEFESTTLRAVMSAPLQSGDKVEGVIGVGLDNTSSRSFGQQEVDLLCRFAQFASIALDNALLYSKLQKELEERVRAEREMATAKEAADLANRTKSQFLANMSHELRTPLNAIIGYSEMLEEDVSDAGRVDWAKDLGKIHSAGKHLLALINDILDLSKIEAGKMDLYLESFDITDMIGDVVNTINPLVEKNGNALIQNVPSDLGTMYGDLTKVRQTLFNLLSNACKFTENGTITLTATLSGSAGEEQVRFVVADTGIGMSEEQMARLFQPFSQADPSTTRRFGGTGLGLTLTRRFCQMMGGEVAVQSVPERGTLFTILLPVHQRLPESEQTDEESLPEGSSRPTILIIDDDPHARDLLSRSLAKEGYHPLKAASGEEGLQLARTHAVSAILLDVMMPSVDGWAVLTTLKADPALAHIPVVMVTMVDDRNLGYMLGAADFLPKPIDRDRLKEILARYLGDAGATVLVVEDDVATREMLARWLEKADWHVLEAGDGRAGLMSMASVRPDLVLLDLMMPEMDGFEFLEQMRVNPGWQSIPVVVLTAKDISGEDRLRLSGNAAHVLKKGGYRREDLISQVRKLIGRPGGTTGGER